MHGVLNEVYLQKFLHGCAVNRETNLMSLLNPWFATVMLQYPFANYRLSRLIRFASRFTTHPCKKIINRFHLVLYAIMHMSKCMMWCFWFFKKNDVMFLAKFFWLLNTASTVVALNILAYTAISRPNHLASWILPRQAHIKFAAQYMWRLCNTRNIGALTPRLQVLCVWVWPINLGKEKRSIHRSTMTDGIMFGKLR